LLAEQPLRNIAELSGTSATALHRHRKSHIPPALASTKRAAEEVNAETLFDRLRAMNRETAAILADARASNLPALALQAIARVEKQIELEGRLLGGLNDSVKVAVGIKVNSQEPSEEVKTLARLLTTEQLQTIHDWMFTNGGGKDQNSVNALCKDSSQSPRF